MKLRWILPTVSAFLVGATAMADDYDVVDRYKLIEDKFYTHEMLEPLKHDFLFDVAFYLNQDVTKVIDDAEAAANTQGTTQEQLDAATDFLNKYNKTEQVMRFKLNLGVPLPSWTMWGIRVRPDLRVNVGVGALLGIRSTTFSFADILDYLGNDVPSEIKTLIAGCTSIPFGEDIMKYAAGNGTGGANPCGLTAAQRTVASTLEGKYFMPSSDQFPAVHSYMKGDGRAGVNFNWYTRKHWFGNVKFYGHGVIDSKLIASSTTIANNPDAVGDLGEDNHRINIETDLKGGYKNGNLRVSLGIEEIKLATIADKKSEGLEPEYGNDPLFRLHGDYKFRFVGFAVRPFVGLHKRSGYSFAEGLYGGTDIGLFFWKDRIGFRGRGMIDSEHFTLSPLFKLWLVHLEYMLKLPIKSDVDGVKPSTIHSVNLRISI